MNKSEIDEFIILFDSKMISSGKKYLSLRTANEILNDNDKNINLKELLKAGKIPNAFQTETTPKQWRISFSDVNSYAEKRKEYLRNNPKEPTQVISSNPQKNNYGCLIFIIAAIVIGYFALPSDDKKAKSGDLKSEACVISQRFVERKLLSPKSADFGFCSDSKVTYLGNNKYQVTNTVDASNAFGAALRKTYFVIIQFNSGDWTDINNWTLETIEIE
ncbi:MAG: hypothetical protein QM541_10775 [Flavobacterium sp.]|nr:hypothetical protein [Flavobacterium sp.]